MLTKDYWQNRYEQDKTGWDAGQITTPIKEYFDQLDNKNVKLLIPGCGNAHEATYLFEQGFTNLYLCDWAQAPLDNFAAQNPNFPKDQLICANFFELQEENFDYVIEQTFLCALDPELRPQYALKMSQILKKEGKLIGLLFGPDIVPGKEGLPRGGTIEEYLGYFSPLFSSVSIEPCLNSIPPRLGTELFIELTK